VRDFLSGAYSRVIKDVMGFNQAPLDTALHKLHPIFESFVEMAQNKDFYGGIISNPYDSTLKQVMDWGWWVIDQMTPFSFKGFERLRRAGVPNREAMLSLFGFQPAPGYISEPDRIRALELRSLRPAIRRKQREMMMQEQPEAPPQQQPQPAGNRLVRIQ
jgi:hypothetical protein